jgi:anthranilate synthase component 2
MKDKILIVDNYDSFTFNLIQIIREVSRWGWTIVKNDEIGFEEVDRYRKILISPGPGVPSEAGKLLAMITEFAPKKSILGICLGHQAIAEAFGGELIRLDNVVHGQRKEVIIHDRTEYLFKGLPKKFEVGLYHSWSVSPDHFPRCLQITASDVDGSIMSLAHTVYDVRGIQFHPESIMTAPGKKIISNWLKH